MRSDGFARACTSVSSVSLSAKLEPVGRPTRSQLYPTFGLTVPSPSAVGRPVSIELTMDFAYPDLCDGEVRELLLTFQGLSAAVRSDVDARQSVLSLRVQYYDCASMNKLMRHLFNMLSEALCQRVLRVSACESGNPGL